MKVQSIPVSRSRRLTLSPLPLLILLLLGLGFLLRTSLPFSRKLPYSGRTTSPFLVDKSLFLPPSLLPARPAYLPEPLPPKKRGMVVPDSLHYVYGLKPVAEGEHGEELPYYAYLAMRSAMLNLQPAKIYLSVCFGANIPQYAEDFAAIINTFLPDLGGIAYSLT